MLSYGATSFQAILVSIQDLTSGSDKDSDEEDELLQISEDQELLDYEFEQCLVLQLMEKVITYMSSIHLSDLLGTYKDN